jgi:hypothetical protein
MEESCRKARAMRALEVVCEVVERVLADGAWCMLRQTDGYIVDMATGRGDCAWRLVWCRPTILLTEKMSPRIYASKHACPAENMERPTSEAAACMRPRVSDHGAACMSARLGNFKETTVTGHAWRQQTDTDSPLRGAFVFATCRCSPQRPAHPRPTREMQASQPICRALPRFHSTAICSFEIVSKQLFPVSEKHSQHFSHMHGLKVDSCQVLGFPTRLFVVVVVVVVACSTHGRAPHSPRHRNVDPSPPFSPTRLGLSGRRGRGCGE